jgi:hypothetical protein
LLCLSSEQLFANPISLAGLHNVRNNEEVQQHAGKTNHARRDVVGAKEQVVRASQQIAPHEELHLVVVDCFIYERWSILFP